MMLLTTSSWFEPLPTGHLGIGVSRPVPGAALYCYEGLAGDAGCHRALISHWLEPELGWA
jgi:hypothetical protein